MKRARELLNSFQYINMKIYITFRATCFRTPLGDSKVRKISFYEIFGKKVRETPAAERDGSGRTVDVSLLYSNHEAIRSARETERIRGTLVLRTICSGNDLRRAAQSIVLDNLFAKSRSY